MTIDLTIVNGKIFTSEGFKEGGIAIEGESILKVGKEPSLPKASLRINVKGALILPGLIDIHVHLRDFDQKQKETVETGTKAALAGGVTTVVDMPNNKPPMNSLKQLKKKEALVVGKAAVNVGFYSLLPETLEEIFSLARGGIFGFKIYPSATLYPHKKDEQLQQYMAKIALTSLPLIIHADAANAAEKEAELYSSNLPAIAAFLKAHPPQVEAQALKDFIILNEESKARLHCAHISSKKTTDVLEEYSKKTNLSSEVCPHYLFLTEKELQKQQGLAKCLPPLRTTTDQKALWQALIENKIKIIATDHAPHRYKEKFCEFEHAASGIAGLETLLPLMFTAAFKGKISFEGLIPKLTKNPAQFLGVADRGELLAGNFADVIVLAKEKTIIRAEEFQSKAKWSPFDGFHSAVTLKHVFVNGAHVKDEGHIILKARTGKLLKSKVKISEERVHPTEED
ncbi:MAG: dihydroorotase [Candidatus Heimdallarchaeota archaeon]